MSNRILGSISYGVTVGAKTTRRYNVTTRSGIIMARKLADLQDVDLSNQSDQYVLMYDSESATYKSVNPDQVLSSAVVSEPNQPGLPQEVIDYFSNVVSPQFRSLSDVDSTNEQNNYIIIYDSSTGKYTVKNPDEVLRASVTDPIEPGLPDELIDQLDVDLDNRIDFDGGEY
jgi:hypothetical protein